MCECGVCFLFLVRSDHPVATPLPPSFARCFWLPDFLALPASSLSPFLGGPPLSTAEVFSSRHPVAPASRAWPGKCDDVLSLNALNACPCHAGQYFGNFSCSLASPAPPGLKTLHPVSRPRAIQTLPRLRFNGSSAASLHRMMRRFTNFPWSSQKLPQMAIDCCHPLA